MGNMPSLVEATPPPPTNTIPLKPEEANHPLVVCWRKEVYLALKAKLALKNKSMPKEDSDLAVPVMCLWMVDQNGQHISSGIRHSLRQDIFAYWTGIDAGVERLTIFTDTPLARKEDFHQTFEAKYPRLRLCEGHWKVDQLWISYFSSWRRPHSSPTPEKTGPITKGQSPFEMAVEESRAPVPAKRKSDDSNSLNEDPSKCFKGKAVDIMAPTNFHHKRPQPRLKRISATTAKVSRSFGYLWHIY